MEQEKPQPIATITTTPTATTTTASTASKPRLALSPLTRFHAGYFRISLSLCAQALLWRTLSSDANSTSAAALSDPLHLLLRHLPSAAFILLWSLALTTLSTLSLLFLLRCLLNPRSLRSEFSHHIGVNYLFAPWISWLLLLQSSPFLGPGTPSHLILLFAFSLPIAALDVKIYSQWFTKGKRFLSVVANLTSQMFVIGNLVAARAAAMSGWRECVVFLFLLGITHYLVLFVTFLAWDSIAGTFDTSSKMFFFLSLFIFASLICRPALFKRSMKKFHVAWWAYPFPLTALALTSAEYARVVDGEVAHWLMLVLSVLSVLVTLALMVFSTLNTKALLPHHDPFVSLPVTNSSRGPSSA
ncbi:S-type anion channel SLAH1 [Acorus gramineus]|uniref:S-type anion channel SLAH1 n=1 Tax=Acorus gramineus TaxID=55184 RepID=A0AAV9BHK7_ACOGR|nr:S-type anion channel SLAH1 [Acorus gramineus]